MLGLRFQIRMVSSDEQVTKDPAGRTGLAPPPCSSASSAGATTSRPQMVDEWNRNEWDLPTWKRQNECQKASALF